MISIVSGERFWLKNDQEAKLKNAEFTIKNKGVMKTIFGDPFDEFYDVFLQLTFQSEEAVRRRRELLLCNVRTSLFRRTQMG